MWLIKVILFVALLGVLVVLAAQNDTDPGVTLKFFRWTFTDIALWWVMFGGALIGMLVGILLSALREVRLRMQMSRLLKERKLLDQEIAQLRAAPLSDYEAAVPPPTLPDRLSE